MGLLKERPCGILDRQSEEAEYIQGKKVDTWDITRGNFQVRMKRRRRRYGSRTYLQTRHLA